jgi:hypothetical protein
MGQEERKGVCVFERALVRRHVFESDASVSVLFFDLGFRLVMSIRPTGYK